LRRDRYRTFRAARVCDAEKDDEEEESPALFFFIFFDSPCSSSSPATARKLKRPKRRPILYSVTGNKKHERMAIKKTGNNAATVSDGVSSEEDASTILLCSLSLSLLFAEKYREHAATRRLFDELFASSSFVE